ncbi:MAG: pitrilysin family protein [Clostridia bacterium]
MSKSRIYQFDSGLRMVHRYNQNVRSVAFGVMVGVGSANETKQNNGISHFIEHVFFKGTQKRSAMQISEDIDAVGAQINAYTSKQTTCFYTISVDDQTEKCVEVLHDILFNSTFPEEELEKEKGVVLEEISMSQDDYSDLCLENLGTTYFGENPLGMQILGTRENVKSFTRDTVIGYIKDNYCASSVVISICGNIKFDDAKALVLKYFEGNFSSIIRNNWQDVFYDTTSNNVFEYKPIEQANIGFAFPSVSFSSDDNMAVTLLNTIFGGGMSSRLFQNVREKLGLAYNVYSYPSTYINNGFMNIYIGTNVKSACKATKTVKTEIIKLLNDGIPKQEFERGVQQMRGAYILGQESTSSLMRLDGKFALYGNKLFHFDEKIKQIAEIKYDDVMRVASDTFNFDKVSASYVGKKIDCNLLDVIKK